MITNIKTNARREAPEEISLNGKAHALYHDELPLSVEDLRKVSLIPYSYEIQTVEPSLFIEQQRAAQDSLAYNKEEPELFYTITEIKFPPLYDWCKASLLEKSEYNEIFYQRIDAAPWRAREAYQLIREGEAQLHFLLCFENRIVEIEFKGAWVLTPEQKEIVGIKLDS